MCTHKYHKKCNSKKIKPFRYVNIFFSKLKYRLVHTIVWLWKMEGGIVFINDDYWATHKE